MDSVIFDLDGTLLDSAEQITVVLNSTSAHFGDKYTTLDDLRANLGKPLDSILDSLGLAINSRDKFVSEFRKRLMTSTKMQNKIFPGVEELLTSIKSQGLKIGIATSKPTPLAIEVVRHSVLQDYVDFCQGTDDSLYKPNPSVILKCMKGLNSEKALMVGDSAEDLMAAHGAGILSIGVLQGIHTYEILQNERPLLIVPTISHLSSLWNSLEII